MSYLGNQPAANFASVIKDTFSGDGSTTAFTLSKAATTNGVAVFVENVRQEPTTAYAVSGTTLTFTAAPVSASGNNIYVLHHNAPASTATHPAAQDLTCAGFTSTGIDDNADATAITIDSAENVGIGTTPESHHANWTAIDFGDQGGLAHYDGGATSLSTNLYHDGSWKAKETGTSSRYEIGAGGTHNFYSGASASADAAVTLTNTLSIDENGHVTMPLQSCFQARPTSTISDIADGGSQTLAMATEVFDQNADYDTSNYNFVAPVTGKYLLTLNLRVQSLDTDSAYFQAIILTSNKEYQSIISTNRFSGDPLYWYVGVTVVADMDASDTAIPRVYIEGSNTHQVDMATDSYFSGCLLA